MSDDEQWELFFNNMRYEQNKTYDELNIDIQWKKQRERIFSVTDEGVDLDDKRGRHLWIADSGATCHMTHDMTGFMKTDETNVKLNFAKKGTQSIGRLFGKALYIIQQKMVQRKK